MKKWVILLIFIMGCIGQAPLTELKHLDITPGMGSTFEFYDKGSYVGETTYTVEKKDIYNGKEAYYIREVLDLEGGGLKIHIDASYVVDLYGRSLYYEFEAEVNDEVQTVKAEFLEDHVHEIASKPEQEFDKEVKIGENTFTLDNNMIGQWEVMFRSLHLMLGGDIVVNGYAAQPMSAFTITGKIIDEVPMEASGMVYECFKIDLSFPQYYMYVTEDGVVVKMETKDGSLVIVRRE
jgi:hypothetical protein